MVQKKIYAVWFDEAKGRLSTEECPVEVFDEITKAIIELAEEAYMMEELEKRFPDYDRFAWFMLYVGDVSQLERLRRHIEASVSKDNLYMGCSYGGRIEEFVGRKWARFHLPNPKKGTLED